MKKILKCAMKKIIKNSNLSKHKLIKSLALIMIMTLVPAFVGCGQTQQSGPFSKQAFYFDTICEITIYAMDDESLETVRENGGLEGEIIAEAGELTDEEIYNLVVTDAFRVCADYENMLSKTKENSDIDRINQAKGECVDVDAETLEVIKKGILFGDISDGSFDITIGKASKLWNFHEDLDTGHEAEAIPDKTDIEEAVKHIDYKGVITEEAFETFENTDDGTETVIGNEESEDGKPSQNTTNEFGGRVKLDDPESEIDLGGIAKGYIADKVAQYLMDEGVTDAIVNLGGNIVAIGGKGADTKVNLGITDPRSETGELLGIIPTRDRTIVTSGTYERYIEVDGVKYHHILDPDTGYPVDTDVLQVSIIAGLGHSADCDGLSTTCLAIGSEKGAELIEKLNAEGKFGEIEAIFVTTSGDIIFTNETSEFQLNK